MKSTTKHILKIYGLESVHMVLNGTKFEILEPNKAKSIPVLKYVKRVSVGVNEKSSDL